MKNENSKSPSGKDRGNLIRFPGKEAPEPKAQEPGDFPPEEQPAEAPSPAEPETTQPAFPAPLLILPVAFNYCRSDFTFGIVAFGIAVTVPRIIFWVSNFARSLLKTAKRG